MISQEIYSYKAFDQQTIDGVSEQFFLSGETQIYVFGTFDGAEIRLEYNPIDGEDVWFDSPEDIINESKPVQRMDGVSNTKFRFRLTNAGANTLLTVMLSKSRLASTDDK